MVKEERIKNLTEELFYDISQEWFKGLEFDAYNSVSREGLFSCALTIWLMIVQRLGCRTLQKSLGFLKSSCLSSIFSRLNETSLKLKRDNVSLSTGGYSKAKSRLEEESLNELEKYCKEELDKRSKRTDKNFILDGMVINIPATDQNIKEYLRHTTGGGEIYTPKVRVLTAHSLETGISLKYEIGSMKDSEQALTKKLLSSLPKQSTIMGDRNFGCFSVVYYASLNGHKAVVRLKEDVFNSQVDKTGKPSADIKKLWNATKANCRTDSSIPSNASVEGRFIKVQVKIKGFRDQFLFFFTTTNLTSQEIADMYLKRQQIETQILYIKQVMNMEMIQAKTPTMVRKEISIAYIAYNLVTAIMNVAANKLKIPLKRISFTATKNLIMDFLLTFNNSSTQSDYLDKLFTAIYQTKLPDRKKHRSYPRQLKRSHDKYPVNALVKSTTVL